MSLKRLQENIGVESDGVFGPITMRAAKRHFCFTDRQAAHFFGQVSHESGNFTTYSENLNYSKKGLLSTFGKYFNSATATSYARKPEKIANRVYANRMGNGPESSGDGWKYRGRGALQLTGKNNYKAFAKYLDKPEIVENPDLVATQYSFESARFFFDENDLWIICDRGISSEVIRSLTKRVNGGTNGLADRVKKTQRYYRWVS